MKTIRDFDGFTSRYQFDFDLCSAPKGYAQIDTSQDASYFGIWANPDLLIVATYCEGDITVRIAESDAEFVAEIREIKRWNEDNGHRFSGIDGMCNETLIDRFEALGLGDLLH